jgi:DNA-binding MarR family transcriptional regulator
MQPSSKPRRDAPDFAARFSARLREIERAIARRVRADASCCGMTLSQGHALLEITSAGGLNVRDLSERLGLDKSTLSRTVEGLVASGLAERVPDPGDRRVAVIRPTGRGRETAERLAGPWDKVCAGLLETLPASRRARLVEAVEWIAEALSCTGFGRGTPCEKKE